MQKRFSLPAYHGLTASVVCTTCAPDLAIAVMLRCVSPVLFTMMACTAAIVHVIVCTLLRFGGTFQD